VIVVELQSYSGNFEDSLKLKFAWHPRKNPEPERAQTMLRANALSVPCSDFEQGTDSKAPIPPSFC